MSTINPNEGLDWFRDRGIGDSGVDGEEIYSIAVGSASSPSLSETDTQLENEVYRATNDDSNVSINATSSVGEYDCKITVSGGTEVPAGTDITEIGVFARDPSIDDSNVTETDDTLVHREERSAITITSGDRKTFAFSITITD